MRSIVRLADDLACLGFVSAREPTPWQNLAAAVLSLALSDARPHRGASFPASIRRDAAEFLTASWRRGDRVLWFNILGINASKVEGLIAEVLADANPPKTPDFIGETAIMKDESGPRPCNEHGPEP